MSESASTGDRLTYLLIGAGIGAVVALLFAPKPGRELRQDIADAGRKAYKVGTDTAAGARAKVTEGVDTMKDSVVRQKSQLAHAVEAGKTAYREERNRGDS